MEGEENSWNKKTPWSNDSIQLLLKLWEEHEELYNIKHQHYQNKHRRWAALRNIANKLSILRPNTSPEDIKHKMNIIRTQYGSDLKRFITEENRQPTIWWFELAGFLNKYIKHRKEGGGTSGSNATSNSSNTKVGGIKKEITNEEFIQHYQKQQLQHHLQQQQLHQLAHQTNELKKKYDKNEIEIIPSFQTLPTTNTSSSLLAASSSSLTTATTTPSGSSATQSSSSHLSLPSSHAHSTGSTTSTTSTTTSNILPMQTAPLALKHQSTSSLASIPNVVSQLKRKFDESHYQSNLKHFHNQHQLNHRKNLNHVSSLTGTLTSLSSGTSLQTSQSNKNLQYKCDDEYDIVGRNVALKLSNMKVRQKVFAEKLISDILYYGQLDLLNLTTTIIIGDDLEEDDDDYSSNDTDPLNFVDVTTDGPADSTKIE